MKPEEHLTLAADHAEAGEYQAAIAHALIALTGAMLDALDENDPRWAQ